MMKEGHHMPLLQFHLVRHAWTKEQVQTILDTAYDVTREAFHAPAGDRYQIVSYHEPEELVMEDTGLGFTRTNKRILLSIRTRPRTQEEKLTFYRLLHDQLQQKLELDDHDLMINLVENQDEDWSFTSGKAQFITGEL